MCTRTSDNNAVRVALFAVSSFAQIIVGTASGPGAVFFLYVSSAVSTSMVLIGPSKPFWDGISIASLIHFIRAG